MSDEKLWDIEELVNLSTIAVCDHTSLKGSKYEYNILHASVDPNLAVEADVDLELEFLPKSVE